MKWEDDIMKMIDYKQALPTIQKQLKHCTSMQCTLATFKKDRQLIITKENDHYHLLENGYIKDEYDGLSEKELIKCLKKQMKVEFPRSHKLYIDIKVH